MERRATAWMLPLSALLSIDPLADDSETFIHKAAHRIFDRYNLTKRVDVPSHFHRVLSVFGPTMPPSAFVRLTTLLQSCSSPVAARSVL